MVAQNSQKFSNSCLKPVHTLTDVEQAKFVAYFYKQDGPRIQNELRVRDRLIVLLMLDAGLRVGEVVKLTVSDLHVAGSTVGMIFIRPEISKTKTERRVPVTVRLHESIQEVFLNTWQRWNVQPFTLALQDPWHGRNISARRIQQITKSAGIASIGRPVNPHMLRHTFATRLMNKCSIRTVQQLLGHASLSSTQVYTHPNSQDLQSAIESLNT